MVPNWPAAMIVLIISLIYGVIAILSPITVMKINMLWPKFIFPKIVQEENLRPRTRETVYLLDTNPEEYKKRFWSALLAIRISGFIALLIFLVGVLIVALEAIPM